MNFVGKAYEVRLDRYCEREKDNVWYNYVQLKRSKFTQIKYNCSFQQIKLQTGTIARRYFVDFGRLDQCSAPMYVDVKQKVQQSCVFRLPGQFRFALNIIRPITRRNCHAENRQKLCSVVTITAYVEHACHSHCQNSPEIDKVDFP